MPTALIGSQWLALALAVFLATRRLSGAIVFPLPPVPLMITALSLLSWAVALRGLRRLSFDVNSPHPDRCVRSEGPRYARWLPAVVMLLFAVACSYPGGRIVDWIVWLPVLALDRWSDQRFTGVGHHRSSSISTLSATDIEPLQAIQQLTRVRMAGGSEAIRGTLVAEFAPGQRSAIVYVAFCPPFERLPTVELDIAGGPPATVKTAQVLHNGAQLEVRLAQHFESEQLVTVRLFATDAAGTA